MHEPIKADTLQQMFQHSAGVFANKVAFSFPDSGEVTFAEMKYRVDEIRFFLHKHGINKGDKVALLSENMPNWGVSYFGLTTAGVVAVPILIDFSVSEINTILQHSDSKALFISSKIYKRLKNDLAFNSLVVVIDAFEEVYLNDKQIEPISSYTITHRDEFDTYMPVKVDKDDLAVIIYTSGTTGRSKGVMLSHNNLMFESNQLRNIQDVNENDTYLSILPLAHTYECTIGLIMGVHGGATTIYMDRPPTPASLLPVMAKVRPTIMLTVPLIMEKIFKMKIKPTFANSVLMSKLYAFKPTRRLLHRIAGKKLYETFGGRLRFFGIGGAAVDPETEQFLRDAKFPYSCGYGLTETSPLLAGAPVQSTSYRAVGPAVEGIELQIENPNSETGEGEIIVRGANVMMGYYKDPENTTKVLSKDGWFRTGDLGVLREGILYIKGRTKNMILGPSGENIYPEEIEAVLNRMDFVTDSLVYQLKGKLVAKVAINQDEMTKRFEEFKHCAHNMQEEYHQRMEDYLQELRVKVNTQFGRYSQLSKVVLQPVPFEKTPTMKIKRYLYH